MVREVLSVAREALDERGALGERRVGAPEQEQHRGAPLPRCEERRVEGCRAVERSEGRRRRADGVFRGAEQIVKLRVLGRRREGRDEERAGVGGVPLADQDGGPFAGSGRLDHPPRKGYFLNTAAPLTPDCELP